MTYLILANPNSGGKKGQKSLDTLLSYLQKKKITYTLFKTEKAGQESEIIKQILFQKQDQDRILILGGDGTISLAMNHLPPHLPIAYIPAGSGNDFARSLGIPKDPISAFETIHQGTPLDFYILSYQSDHLSGIALNNFGVGLDGQIVSATNQSIWKKVLNKIGIGSVSYLLIALRTLFTKKPFKARILVDNQEFIFDQAWLFDLTKHPYFGGGIKISPDQSNLSPDFSLIEINKVPVTQFFGLLRKILKGTHLTDPRVTFHQGTEIVLTVSSTEPIQIDGEAGQIYPHVPIRLKTEKRTIIR